MTARLALAYDFVSAIPYLADDAAALKFSRTKRFDEFDEEELASLADRARLAKALVLNTAQGTVALSRETWEAEKSNLPFFGDVTGTIDTHLEKIPLAST